MLNIANQTTRHRVLLVEDEEATRNYLADAISRHPGLELQAACADLATARQAFATSVPDVLVTDLALPDGDGHARGAAPSLLLCTARFCERVGTHLQRRSRVHSNPLSQAFECLEEILNEYFGAGGADSALSRLGALFARQDELDPTQAECGRKGGIDSNRRVAILTPAGRTSCVQNAAAFCRTGFCSSILSAK